MRVREACCELRVTWSEVWGASYVLRDKEDVTTRINEYRGIRNRLDCLRPEFWSRGARRRPQILTRNLDRATRTAKLVPRNTQPEPRNSQRETRNT
jgi:hypothetical protein